MGDSPSLSALSFCRRSTSKPCSPYADSKMQASASVNRKKERKFLTRFRPRAKKTDFRSCVFFIVTLFNNVLISDYYLSDETRGIRLASIGPANRNQAKRDRLFLVRFAVIAVWMPRIVLVLGALTVAGLKQSPWGNHPDNGCGCWNKRRRVPKVLGSSTGQPD
jgi:hypothetical protein